VRGISIVADYSSLLKISCHGTQLTHNHNPSSKHSQNTNWSTNSDRFVNTSTPLHVCRPQPPQNTLSHWSMGVYMSVLIGWMKWQSVHSCGGGNFLTQTKTTLLPFWQTTKNRLSVISNKHANLSFLTPVFVAHGQWKQIWLRYVMNMLPGFNWFRVSCDGQLLWRDKFSKNILSAETTSYIIRHNIRFFLCKLILLILINISHHFP
jgi:hypothetical protein